MGCASDYGRPCEPNCSSCRREREKVDRKIDEEQQEKNDALQVQEMALQNRGKELRHAFNNYMNEKLVSEIEQDRLHLLSQLKQEYDEKVKVIEKKLEKLKQEKIKAKWEELVKTLS